MRYAIGVDLSALRTTVALGVEDKGHLRIMSEVSEPTVKTGDKDAVIKQVINLIRKVCKPDMLKKVVGIGIGCAGILDIKRGLIVRSPNLKVTNIPVRDVISEVFGCEVKILNDCTAGVLGEKFYGCGRPYANVAYVSIETGIGGGVITDGHLLLGKDGNAVEVGHVTIKYDSPLICSCGKRGHWEAYSSEKGIPNFFKLFLKNMQRHRLNDSIFSDLLMNREANISTKLIFNAARKRDYIAKKFVDELNKINAAGLAIIINAYDPEIVTLGGRLFIDNVDLLFKPLIKYVHEYVTNRIPTIKVTPLNDKTTIYGILALIFHGIP